MNEEQCKACDLVQTLLSSFNEMVHKHKDDFPPHLFALYIVGFCVDVMQCCTEMNKPQMKKIMLEAFRWSTERYENSQEVDNADSK